mgnify:CR=1 FL=1
MLVIRRLFQTILLMLIAVGCSKFAFEADKNFNKCHKSGLACTLISDNIERFEYDIKVGSGVVDILIVDDNSGSMSPEQAQMAGRFPNFLQSLANLDYHIAITTTDVSASMLSINNQWQPNGPKPANGNGAFQDGKFIPFSPGLSVLTRDTANKESLFYNTVQRPETLSCEQNDFSLNYCPSPDERGIYAARLAVERADPSFFRASAHLALVVLADEDERSQGGQVAGYPLEEKDMPEGLIAAVKSKFGGAKTFSAHAIIVKPGDDACLNAQTATFGTRTVRGFFGSTYARLAELTSGVVGSICSSDYGAQLGEIGFNIQDQVNSKGLACKPIDNLVDVQVTPLIAGLTITYDDATNTVKFSQMLPPNTNIHLKYDCFKL